MKGLRSVGVLLAMVTGFVFLPTAAETSFADTASIENDFSAVNCILANGGQKTVPAGTTIVIRQGLGSGNPRGVLQNFVDAQSTIVSVNDAQMSDVSDQWSAPEEQPDGSFLVLVKVPTGVTLANPGDRMRFTFAIVLSHIVAGPGGPPFNRGLLFGGTCTVTAT